MVNFRSTRLARWEWRAARPHAEAVARRSRPGVQFERWCNPAYRPGIPCQEEPPWAPRAAPAAFASSAASTCNPTAGTRSAAGVPGGCGFAPSGPTSARRRERAALIAAVQRGVVPVSPRLRFDTVACWWLERFEAKVAAGDRRPRTLEAHRYQLDGHLLPAFAARRVASITVDDVAELLLALRGEGCSAKTSAGALATLQSIMRYARRHGWIPADPVDQLEPDEHPRAARRRQRVLGRDEIERLLQACSPRDRLMIATVLYTGLRISEMLGLTWDDIDFAGGVIHVRAQLSRAHRGAPAHRVPPKTNASIRDVPLVAQLARLLAAHKQATPFKAHNDWVFATANGTPHGHRNVTRRGLQRAARLAGVDSNGCPPLRFHDLRHTFASHLILDSAARRGPGQPHARACARHDHPRRLHPPLRQRPPRPRDPRAHDGKPIRRAARYHDRRAQRDSASAPLPKANVAPSRSAAGGATNRPGPLCRSTPRACMEGEHRQRWSSTHQHARPPLVLQPASPLGVDCDARVSDGATASWPKR